MKHLLLAAAISTLVSCGGGGSDSAQVIDQYNDDRSIDVSQKSIAISNLESFVNNGYPLEENRAGLLIPLLENASLADLEDVSILIDEMIASFVIEPTAMPEVTTLIKKMGGDTPDDVSVVSVIGTGTIYFTDAVTSTDVIDVVGTWSETNSNTDVTRTITIATDIDEYTFNIDGTDTIGKTLELSKNVLLRALKIRRADAGTEYTNAEFMSTLSDTGMHAYMCDPIVSVYHMADGTVSVDEFNDNNITVSFHKVTGTETITLTR